MRTYSVCLMAHEEETLDPKPETRNPKPETLNPEHSALREPKPPLLPRRGADADADGGGMRLGSHADDSQPAVGADRAAMSLGEAEPLLVAGGHVGARDSANPPTRPPAHPSTHPPILS